MVLDRKCFNSIKVLCFVLLLQISQAHAQSGMEIPKEILKNGKFAFMTGYNYNKSHWGEVGLVRGWRCNYDKSCDSFAEGLYYYTSLSSEFTVQDQRFIACPKLGYHVEFLVLGIGLNVVDYTDFKSHVFGLRPEIDLSLSSVVGIYYSYNISTKHDWLRVSNHNIGIKVIIGSGLFSPVYLKRQKRKQNPK
jgi:hypothetical protein